MKRTIPQNASLHKYLAWIAEDLANSNVDMKQVITVPITPTMENVKEYMWRVVQTSLYPEKTSSTQLTTIEMQDVYREFDQIMNKHFGVTRPWPSRDSLQEES
jgi:hypothetical protein